MRNEAVIVENFLFDAGVVLQAADGGAKVRGRRADERKGEQRQRRGAVVQPEDGRVDAHLGQLQPDRTAQPLERRQHREIGPHDLSCGSVHLKFPTKNFKKNFKKKKKKKYFLVFFFLPFSKFYNKFQFHVFHDN